MTSHLPSGAVNPINYGCAPLHNAGDLKLAGLNGIKGGGPIHEAVNGSGLSPAAENASLLRLDFRP